MTKVRFLTDNKGIYGFNVSGHSTKSCGDQTGKLVCAAISSAAYMAANTVIEVLAEQCDVEIDDAKMVLEVKNPSSAARAVLEGFKLHMEQLSGQYTGNIKIFGGADHVKD